MTDSAGFHVEVDENPSGVTVTVTGDVDLATIRPLERARDRALAGSPTRVLIDLRAVRFIDSSGLKFLIETDRMCAAAAGRSRCSGPSRARCGCSS